MTLTEINEEIKELQECIQVISYNLAVGRGDVVELRNRMAEHAARIQDLMLQRRMMK